MGRFFYHIIAHFYIFNWEKEKSENNGCQVEGISVKLPGRNSFASGQSEAQRVAVVFVQIPYSFMKLSLFNTLIHLPRSKVPFALRICFALHKDIEINFIPEFEAPRGL